MVDLYYNNPPFNSAKRAPYVRKFMVIWLVALHPVEYFCTYFIGDGVCKYYELTKE
jgi:hypothetical protein